MEQKQRRNAATQAKEIMSNTTKEKAPRVKGRDFDDSQSGESTLSSESNGSESVDSLTANQDALNIPDTTSAIKPFGMSWCNNIQDASSKEQAIARLKEEGL